MSPDARRALTISPVLPSRSARRKTRSPSHHEQHRARYASRTTRFDRLASADGLSATVTDAAMLRQQLRRATTVARLELSNGSPRSKSGLPKLVKMGSVSSISTADVEGTTGVEKKTVSNSDRPDVRGVSYKNLESVEPARPRQRSLSNDIDFVPTSPLSSTGGNIIEATFEKPAEEEKLDTTVLLEERHSNGDQQEEKLANGTRDSNDAPAAKQNSQSEMRTEKAPSEDKIGVEVKLKTELKVDTEIEKEEAKPEAKDEADARKSDNVINSLSRNDSPLALRTTPSSGPMPQVFTFEVDNIFPEQPDDVFHAGEDIPDSPSSQNLLRHEEDSALVTGADSSG